MKKPSLKIISILLLVSTIFTSVAIALLVAVVVTIFSLIGYKLWLAPNIAYLSPEGEAQWILRDRPMSLAAHSYQQSVDTFQTHFETFEPLDHTVLRVRAMRFMRVFRQPSRRGRASWRVSGM